MPEVLVLGVVGLAVDLQRNVMGLGVVYLILAAFELPGPPGGNHFHLRGKRLESQHKAHLIVALAGTAVGNGVGALFEGNFRDMLGDDGAGKGGSKEVVLVAGTCLQRGDYVGIHEFVGDIFNVKFRRAGFDGLLLQTVQLVPLSHIGGNSDNLTVIVVFLEPGNNAGRIESSGIGQHYFFDFRHDFFPPYNKY
ncbi:hypothetical protein SDC9_88878 [bioreactor metagenome]|uniref:Uncharacterized protein n=1 Tax=bioreactor metagenome TaxID=1076179 RepID=A0A644ZMT1_9ZZZZ